MFILHDVSRGNTNRYSTLQAVRAAAAAALSGIRTIDDELVDLQVTTESMIEEESCDDSRTYCYATQADADADRSGDQAPCWYESDARRKIAWHRARIESLCKRDRAASRASAQMRGASSSCYAYSIIAGAIEARIKVHEAFIARLSAA
jgi:hypothetical protein